MLTLKVIENWVMFYKILFIHKIFLELHGKTASQCFLKHAQFLWTFPWEPQDPKVVSSDNIHDYFENWKGHQHFYLGDQRENLACKTLWKFFLFAYKLYLVIKENVLTLCCEVPEMLCVQRNFWHWLTILLHMSNN